MNMTKSKIKKRIFSNNDCYKIWCAEDFSNLPRANVLKALSDLVKDNVLKRAKRGFYYYSKSTQLGNTSYNDYDLAISKIKNKCSFYCVSGVYGYNELGFTNQVPNKIVIACDCNSRSDENIKYIYRKQPVRGGYRERIVLDAIIDIKIIPDTTIAKTIDRIKFLIKEKKVDLNSLVKTSFHEPPRVKAVIGAIAEEFNYNEKILKKLKKEINPLTTIYLNTENTLRNTEYWQIRAKK